MNAILIFLFFFSFSNSQAAIYGKDDRISIVKADAKIQELSKSIFLLIPKSYIADKGEACDLAAVPLKEASGLCPNEKGADTLGFYMGCSGFLVSDDILITAGHCMVQRGEVKDVQTPMCKEFVWVSDFREILKDGKVQPPQIEGVSKDRVFECEKVIYGIHDSEVDVISGKIIFERDFALVKLKKKTGRAPLKLSGVPFPGVAQNAAISMIGYPLAAPATYTANAKILSVESKYYRANLDAFPGSSGAPVFNAKLEVIGLLVRGYPETLIDNRAGECHNINRCDEAAKTCTQIDSEKMGEHIEPISFVKEFLHR
ncbi:MAG: serine protease [Pseudobdellovibrionaceae bacterium]